MPVEKRPCRTCGGRGYFPHAQVKGCKDIALICSDCKGKKYKEVFVKK